MKKSGLGFLAVAFFGGLAAGSFVLAMHCFPGGYNPLMRMLSALGRTEVRLIECPWSHYLFMAGMFFSALAVMSAACRAGLSKLGTALNVAGLTWIALVPEDVSMILHNAGCWLAAAGGGVMLFAWRRAEPARHIRRAWTLALVLPIAAMALALVLHALKVVPFAPLVTTLQKIVILSFAAWLLCLSAKNAGRGARIAGIVFLCVPVLLAAFLLLCPEDSSIDVLLKEADGGGTPSLPDAARWEKWALTHYLSPAFGGGALNLVYHVRGNFMYPRGQDGFDGWSLLWYEAWASDRRMATALWRRVLGELDWSRIDGCGDECGEMDCCDPQPVSASVASVFLAAAARACSDAKTAERLERAVDAKYLKREGGLLWLDVNREWRIGATAMRIISLAESRGSRFRNLSPCGGGMSMREWRKRNVGT